VIAALFIAFAGGAVVGLALVASGRIGRREPMPFGPALAGGAIVGMVAGPQLVRALWPVFG
jgi:leader peptidase (prepilin peptidase)/N-methyltransferase